jgi:hypothetical protein
MARRFSESAVDSVTHPVRDGHFTGSPLRRSDSSTVSGGSGREFDPVLQPPTPARDGTPRPAVPRKNPWPAYWVPPC